MKLLRLEVGLRPTRHALSTVRHNSAKGIDNILVEMKLDNKSDYTINFTRKALNTISKYAALDKPEEVRMFLAMHKASNGYKRNLCIAYNKYCKYYGIQWQMPLYLPEGKAIKIPTREKVEMLIASARKPLSIKLAISKETGLRPIELCNLKVKDVDLEQRLLYPTTAKNG
jgi:integrase